MLTAALAARRIQPLRTVTCPSCSTASGPTKFCATGRSSATAPAMRIAATARRARPGDHPVREASAATSLMVSRHPPSTEGTGKLADRGALLRPEGTDGAHQREDAEHGSEGKRHPRENARERRPETPRRDARKRLTGGVPDVGRAPGHERQNPHRQAPEACTSGRDLACRQPSAGCRSPSRQESSRPGRRSRRSAAAPSSRTGRSARAVPRCPHPGRR